MTLKLAWATDIHLDHCREPEKWLAEVKSMAPDALLLTGDIGTGSSISRLLRLIEEHTKIAIYFVLGNHDFYGRSMEEVRAEVAAVVQNSPFLRWLSLEDVIPLTETTALVGADGWYDGRGGNYEMSRVALSDFRLIREFMWLGRRERLTLMQNLAEASVEHFRSSLESAVAKGFRRIIGLTHVSPYVETALYEGKQSDADFMPFFCNVALGDCLRSFAEKHPDVEILILSGHSHSLADERILPNLRVVSGAAEYGYPEIQRIFDDDSWK